MYHEHVRACTQIRERVLMHMYTKVEMHGWVSCWHREGLAKRPFNNSGLEHPDSSHSSDSYSSNSSGGVLAVRSKEDVEIKENQVSFSCTQYIDSCARRVHQRQHPLAVAYKYDSNIHVDGEALPDFDQKQRQRRRGTFTNMYIHGRVHLARLQERGGVRKVHARKHARATPPSKRRSPQL